MKLKRKKKKKNLKAPVKDIKWNWNYFRYKSRVEIHGNESYTLWNSYRNLQWSQPIYVARQYMKHARTNNFILIVHLKSYFTENSNLVSIKCIAKNNNIIYVYIYFKTTNAEHGEIYLSSFLLLRIHLSFPRKWDWLWFCWMHLKIEKSRMNVFNL